MPYRGLMPGARERRVSPSPRVHGIGRIIFLERAGSDDRPKLRQDLAGPKGFAGVSGKIKIGKDGNAVKSAVILKTDKGGLA